MLVLSLLAEEDAAVQILDVHFRKVISQIVDDTWKHLPQRKVIVSVLRGVPGPDGEIKKSKKKKLWHFNRTDVESKLLCDPKPIAFAHGPARLQHSARLLHDKVRTLCNSHIVL